jgi:hypothetical protein
MIDFNRISYAYQKKRRRALHSSHEESVDWSKAIKPVFHAFVANDTFGPLHPGVIDLINSINFDGLLEYPNGTNPENTPQERAHANAIWAYIATTYMAPMLYYAYGNELLEELSNNCAVQCSYDFCSST